jgi:hypothetical protein
MPPRYTYAVHVATEGYAPPKELHFSNNVLHPGTQGVSRMSLWQLKRGRRFLGTLSRDLSFVVKSLAQDKTVQCFE